jgi:2-keto-4-pentenoate hydratase/2-oxohepta-3-ene-1,7-dioic acid hydratase in catechol pathway
MKSWRLTLLAGVLLSLIAPRLSAQTADAPREPFKLGTFAQGDRVLLGLVLKDTRVVDLARANQALESENPGWPKAPLPEGINMKQLIRRYDAVKKRLYAIVNHVAAGGAGDTLHDIKALALRPPVFPGNLLNAAVNYTEHANEMAQRPGAAPDPTTGQAPQSAPGLWERKAGDTRQNPYLFQKPSSVTIASEEAIRIPPGRDRIDWECELAVVIGGPASRVPLERAREQVFGYTLLNDVSDRGGRGDRRHGSDWLIGKGHDTFAPLGPFIVPREFVKDPQKLSIQFTLSGKLMQDSNTEKMIHTVDELVHFASNILTLHPGDVIATGSPAGVGSARNPPIFMKAGDRAVCTIEGIGTLSNPVVDAGGAPAPTPSSR